VKGNHGQVHDLVAEWVARAGVNQRPPDHVQTDKGHGRLERRELWVVAAGDLRTYLQEDFDWPAVRFVGQIRRYRRQLHQTDWESVMTTLWMAGGTHCPDLTPAQLQYHLRAHWAIENAVFYVRDVTFAEDFLHARKIAFSLSALRNGAINLIRQAGFHYIPDARRLLAATPGRELMWLFAKPSSLEN
jgi:hypothetical protein